MVKNVDNKLEYVKDIAVLEWYYDYLPTNCVADWVCAGCKGCNDQRFSYSPSGPEYGYKNLAVFYGACSFNCLYCQNWHFKYLTLKKHPKVCATDLAGHVDEKTSCICYFGGDPGPQIEHALTTSQLAIQSAQETNKIVRICWETNGSVVRKYIKEMAHYSLNSGGCIKFDLKAFTNSLHIALTGAPNKITLRNFEYLGKYIEKRPKPPFLIASTLLVPGYIDVPEVKLISEFISSINENIPYALLAFHPCFRMLDLPQTSKNHALNCKKIAEKMGLKNVKIGNIHLLSNAY
jgi:pyruvate formate lyase activating enzyme